MKLPAFKYHPDPVRSGSIEESKKKCRCCSKARGYIYAGPAYCEEELEEALCPWCIADGLAHEKFDAAFVDCANLPEDIPPLAATELAERTPGFNSWQTEQWLSCCGDAMAFLEPVGIAEIRSRYSQAENYVLDFIRNEFPGVDPQQMLEALHRDKGPTAYLFQCLHCGTWKSYVDGIFEISA